MVKRTKISFRMLLNYFLVVFIIFSESVMYHYIRSSSLTTVSRYCTIGMLLILIMTRKKVRLKKRFLSALLFVWAYILVYIAMTRYKMDEAAINLLGLFSFAAVYFYQCYEKGDLKDIVNAYVNVICAIAVISLFGWLFGTILDVLPGKRSITYTWAGKQYRGYSYYNLYFETIQRTNFFSSRITRNCGIFTEAPGYTCDLWLALCLELFAGARKGGVSKPRVLILLLTLASTLSTKGTVIAVLAMVLYFYTFLGHRKGLRVFLTILAVAVIIVPTVSFVRNVLTYKMNTSSYSIRMDDLYANYVTWKKHPIFGVGYNNRSEIMNHTLLARREGTGITIGIMLLLAEGGVWLFLMYLAIIILTGRVIRLRNGRQAFKNYCAFAAVFLINLSISGVQFFVTTLMLMAAGFAYMTFRPSSRPRQLRVLAAGRQAAR